MGSTAAYQAYNQFINSPILHLTGLRKKSFDTSEGK